MARIELCHAILCHAIFINFKVIYHKLKKCFNSRSSHQSCPIEKADFKNFAIFTGKHLCWSLLLIDLWASRAATFLKKGLRHRCFPVNIAKFLRTIILVKICEQVLLQFLLLTVNISSWVLVSALNSIGLLQRSSSRFKEFSLGCLMVGSSLIWKKRKISRNGHLLSLDVPLVCLFINDPLKIMKNALYFILKALFVVKILSLDFLVYQGCFTWQDRARTFVLLS